MSDDESCVSAVCESDEAVCVYGIFWCMASSVGGGVVAWVVLVLPETVDEFRWTTSGVIGSSVCVDMSDFTFVLGCCV